MTKNVDSRMEGHDSVFNFSGNPGQECEFSRICEKESESKNENEAHKTEIQVLCETLKLSGGSKYEDVSTLFLKNSNSLLQIDDSVEIIVRNDFFNNDSFSEVIFSSMSQLRWIRGFHQCRLLSRIEIASSVETTCLSSFFNCTSLKEVVFSSDSHLRHLSGFQECRGCARVPGPLLSPHRPISTRIRLRHNTGNNLTIYTVIMNSRKQNHITG
jgi:hypothetical protein